MTEREQSKREFAFGDLASADLVVGGCYRGGSSGSSVDDPLDKLLHCGNMGGFRIRGGETRGGYRLAVLYTTFHDADWPDSLDPQSGRFLYYGDNKTPGRELHDTNKGGNKLLRYCFEKVHTAPPRRDLVPPFFVFSKAGHGRDVIFHGMAAPGARDLSEADDLIATWKTRGGERFQNYRAVFTILDAPSIGRPWLDSLIVGSPSLNDAPAAWREWVEKGSYAPLT